MLVRYYGHSLFLLTSADGYTVATDPYDASVGYPLPTLYADAVTISHDHHDHNNVALIRTPEKLVVTRDSFSGWKRELRPAKRVRIRAVETFHDDHGGALRGKNLMFVIEMDGVTFLHAGDLGHPLTAAQAREVGHVDVLLAPVGGFYTIGPREADDLRALLSPHTFIPMHYKTTESAGMPIASVSDYLALTGEKVVPIPLLRVTEEDLSEQPRIVVMAHGA